MRRYRRRDWKDPFSWFRWAQMGRSNVLFRYQPGAACVGASAPTFTRADASTCATYVDANGVVQTVAANVLRDNHYVSGVRTTLLEGSRQNLTIQSEKLATGWTQGGTITTTEAFSTAGSLSFCKLAGGGGGGYVERSVTIASSAQYSMTAYFKIDSGATTGGNLYLFDSTATAYRIRIQVLISAGGVVTVGTVTTGTSLGVDALGNGVYRVKLVSTSCTGGNPHVHGFEQVAAGQSLQLTGIQVELGAFPSSYIATGASAVTRAADALSFPFGPVPQAMTVYGKGVFYGAVDSTTNYTVAMISNSGSGNPYLWLRNDASVNKAQTLHHNGSVLISNSATGTAFASGDTGELRGVLQADGSVITGVSVNGAAESVSSASAANALAAAWASMTLYVGAQGNGTQCVFAGIQKLVIASGVQSLATMRGL